MRIFCKSTENQKFEHSEHLEQLLNMSSETCRNIASQISRARSLKCKMITCLDLCILTAGSILCSLSIREDLGPTARTFKRKHMLALWMSYMVCLFTGGIFINLLLGKPMLSPLTNNEKIVIATSIWFFIFYTPFDLGYKVVNHLPLKMVCVALREISRCRRIRENVQTAARVYPGAYLIMIIIGTISGNAGFVKIIERFIRGVWPQTTILEFLKPSFWTKASFFASVIFVLDSETRWVPNYKDCTYVLYLAVDLFFISYSIHQYVSMAINQEDHSEVSEGCFSLSSNASTH